MLVKLTTIGREYTSVSQPLSECIVEYAICVKDVCFSDMHCTYMPSKGVERQSHSSSSSSSSEGVPSLSCPDGIAIMTQRKSPLVEGGRQDRRAAQTNLAIAGSNRPRRGGRQSICSYTVKEIKRGGLKNRVAGHLHLNPELELILRRCGWA